MVTKEELIKEVSAATQIGRKEVEKVFNTTIEIIANTLRTGEEVYIANFGKFMVKDLKERRARNPRTGEFIIASPKKHVLFHASNSLKRALNKIS